MSELLIGPKRGVNIFPKDGGAVPIKEIIGHKEFQVSVI